MSYRRTRVLISLGAVIALIAYLIAPQILDGAIIARLDSTAFLLLAVAALPWLALLVSEFEAFGMKAKMVEVDKKADEATDIAKEARDAAAEARSAAAEASAAADLASEAATEARAVAEDRAIAPDFAELLNTPFSENGEREADAVEDTSPLLDLAAKYVETRSRHSSGPDRTSMMTTIFTQMQHATRALGTGREDVVGWLTEPDAGKQLAAIAYLRSYPETAPPVHLVDAIGRAGEPFVQYWALRALSGRVDKAGIDGFSIADRERLKSYEASIKRGTDRHIQLTRLNQRLDALV